MTTETLQTLRAALRRRLDLVADREFCQRDPAAHLAELQEASAAVTQLSAALPGTASPQLRHYLERQSYVKALAWLDGELA